MLLFFKKKNGDGETDVRKSSAPPPASATTIAEFLPYYCHYNPTTLLTKNGELMQIIKIVTNVRGLDYESSNDPSAIVREVIRSAVVESIQDDRFALWIHTIRKRHPIRYRGKFKEAFATAVYERWQQKNRWKYQYYNEIYISILYDGQSAALGDTRDLKDVFLPKRNRGYRNAYLEIACEELDKTVADMMARIRRSFNVEKLAVVERVPPQNEVPVNRAVFYSEPMEFLGNVLNLRSESFLLPQLDVSEALSTTVQTFGFNALETKNSAGKRRFGAILTLKQYREVPPETIDRLLQAPMEFIISQAFHFIPHTGALKQYKEQKELLDISGDTYCIDASGVTDMMASQSEHPTDFGEHQTSIMVIADEFKQVDGEVSKVQSAFADLGLITIREDIKLEECFWSLQPGNFEFIRRRDTINTVRVGGFCRLNRYPQGVATGNHWGDAVTIFPTLVGSPYFFNFHHQDNGHTALLDFNSFGDHVNYVLMNFLLTESRKFDGRIYLFDRNRSADLLFEKLGGHYHYFASLSQVEEREMLQMNPFTLPDNPRNRSFILAWIGLMISPDVGLPEAQKEILKAAIEHIYSSLPAKRTLNSLVEYVGAQNASLAKGFAKWHGEGIYAGLFGATEEKLDLRESLHAFDMNPVIRNQECVLPVFAYLLHRIMTSIDGRPSIIVLYDALDLLDNPFIAPRLESLMEMLQQNNSMMLFTFGKPVQNITSPLARSILKQCVTHIILPDDVGRDYAVPELGLDEYDSRRLVKMDRQKGDFLLKQNNETIALRAHLTELDELHAVFSNDRKNLAAALGKFSESKLNSGQT